MQEVLKPSQPDQLEENLRYRFNNKALLNEALRHSSYVNEQPATDLRDNECLEFLGDAVLNLIVGHLLMEHYKDQKEGELSRMRANLVNETQLAAIARRCNLGSFILLGKGEILTNGSEKNSILADAFEAMVAAIYLDGGFASAFKIVKMQFSDLIRAVKAPSAYLDYKSQLQELAQVKHHLIPQYEVAWEKGPDHDKIFAVNLKIKEMTTQGFGKSKKLAEQDAAKKALEMLQEKTTVK